MHLNWRKDKKYVVYYTMEYYSKLKHNDILKFACIWMEVEKIILSEVTQTQIDKHGMYSLISEH